MTKNRCMKKCKELFKMEEDQFRILQRGNQKLRCPKEVTKGGVLENHRKKKGTTQGEIWNENKGLTSLGHCFLHNKDKKDSSFGSGDIIQQLRAHTGLAKDLS